MNNSAEAQSGGMRSTLLFSRLKVLTSTRIQKLRCVFFERVWSESDFDLDLIFPAENVLYDCTVCIFSSESGQKRKLNVSSHKLRWTRTRLIVPVPVLSWNSRFKVHYDYGKSTQRVITSNKSGWCNVIMMVTLSVAVLCPSLYTCSDLAITAIK